MRLSDFSTCYDDEYYGRMLYAFARYKRGDIPTKDEYDEINNRVLSRYPKAEFVGMRRYLVPVENGKKVKEVRWEFKWIQFNENQREC